MIVFHPQVKYSHLAQSGPLRLPHVFCTEFNHNAVGFRASSRAGVFTTTDGTLSAEEYVKRADAAMYHAKNSGRNQVVVWQE